MTKLARGTRRFARAIAGLGVMLVLSACQAPPNFGEPEETFGAAVRHNIAVQTVDPNPQNRMPAPGHDASRAARSIARYQTDQVKKPAEIRTSGMGGGSGK